MFTAGGDAFAVDEFLLAHTVAPKDVWHRGEPRRYGKLRTWSGFTLVASEAEFTDLDRQVQDVIGFIQKHAAWLEALVAYPGAEFTSFDFGVEILSGTPIPSVYFPPDLVKAAGHIGLGLQASIYWPLSTSNEATGA